MLSIKKLSRLLFFSITIASNLPAQFSFPGADSIRHGSEQDHQKMMELLNITALRPGVNGSNLTAPNAVNYDESKANPYPDLPDPLKLRNGTSVTTEEMWWKQRRPEIVEDFDREIYGRVPSNTPAVRWEVTSTTRETNGGFPFITKKLTGHVDNSSFPSITVDINLTLSTPADAKGQVPVIMEFSFVSLPDLNFPAIRAVHHSRRVLLGSSKC